MTNSFARAFWILALLVFAALYFKLAGQTIILPTPKFPVITASGPYVQSSDPTAQATQIIVFRSQTSGAQVCAGPQTPLCYFPIAALAITPQAPSYRDIAAIAGQTYFYVFAAINATGMSPFTNEISIAVPSVPIAPPGISVQLR